MKNTPVKIRGKRGNRKRAQEQSQTPPLPSNSSKSTSRELKRRFVSAGPNQTPAKRRRVAKATADTRSPLERLPNELLQEIFLLSGNIELPGCSLSLARSLSGNKTIQLSFVLGRHPNTSKPLDATDAAVITRILKCRFVTWPFLQSWIHAAYTLDKQQHHHHNHPTKPKRSHITPRKLIAQPDQQPASPSSPPTWFNFHPPLNRDDEDYHVCIPRKLLRGPWTSDDTSSLTLLTHAGAVIADLELARRGLRKAIATANLRVIYSLVYVRSPQSQSRQEQQQQQQRWGSYVRVTTEILRFAVVECGCDPSVVWVLLHTGSFDDDEHQTTTTSTINFMDPPMWAWADDAEARGDWAGTFLKSEFRACLLPRPHTPVGVGVGDERSQTTLSRMSSRAGLGREWERVWRAVDAALPGVMQRYDARERDV
ncbi:hypothetical protein EJ05DRAFT_480476 [Pseudovirgaria hyperparasitica]|uniref:Uncharacterized protein n=1 Tax=Pseudovirgaria hyperparasitica TaxID=470096 RepID=A0A6A6VV23_9PEZI|nr:uncharacterized protein EJ05DRAFT_480476 [Pseudovirgaria hyperparasitica]KAF2753470.1 hypothetical protein EJ05DRAFT_480476 [Pseudovirgaria hyperparasitica]